MKLDIHKYNECLWGDYDYKVGQLDTDELKTRLTEIANELPEIKADAIYNAIKLIERLEHVHRLLCSEIVR